MIYHKNLSYFSKPYSADLQSRHGDDSEYLYILNGKVISDKPDKIYMLNKIPALNIKAVSFTPAKEALGSPAVVVIKTDR